MPGTAAVGGASPFGPHAVLVSPGLWALPAPPVMMLPPTGNSADVDDGLFDIQLTRVGDSLGLVLGATPNVRSTAGT